MFVIQEATILGFDDRTCKIEHKINVQTARLRCGPLGAIDKHCHVELCHIYEL